MRNPNEIKIGDTTLDKVLENHLHWLKEDCKGWENMRADLRNADLSEIYLFGVNLKDAYLNGVNLSNADLRSVNFRNADLSEANLSNAYLIDSNLRNADLSEANLSNANLKSADLRGANFQNAENVPFIPYTCPDFGMFIGFKKASGHIIVLEIPEDAKRLSATGRKCRCNKAKVLEIQEYDGTKSDLTEVKSDWDRNFIYKVGKTATVDDFDEDRWNECTTGIHFYINRQEAVNHEKSYTLY